MKELRRLNSYFLRYKFRLFLGVIFVIISNYFAVIPAKIVRLSFNLVSENILIYRLFSGFHLQRNIYEWFSSIVLFCGSTILLMYLLRGFFLFLMRQTIIVVSRLIEYDMKNDIYSHYQDLPLLFYRRNNTGDLMNRITEDVSRVRMYVGPAVMYAINTVILLFMITGVMLSINVRLTLYSLLPLPIMTVLIYYVNAVIHRKSERIQEQLSRLSTFTQEVFSGIRVMKAYSREKQIREDFDEESEEYKHRAMGLVKVQAFFFPTVLLLVGMSTILIVYIGGLEVKNGTITAGNIAEFIIYINQLTFPMMSLGWVSSLIQRASASQKRINHFLDIKSDIVSGKERHPIKGHIEFKNVNFTYPDTGIKALENVSFSVRPGEFLAIIGRTGSGKSTIAYLLTRMYDVSSGEILIDGINIKDYQLEHLRRSMGIVPQEVFLFSDTIKNNISFGIDDANIQKIEDAAKDAAVYHNIMSFPEDFETHIGERGITLSGGQKQRISIARAIIKHPEILILDDCLSAVDTHTEEQVLGALGKMMYNKTSLIISHRVSTIKNADIILVMDKGQIVEEGSHPDLMNLHGFYADLYEKQLLEEEQI